MHVGSGWANRAQLGDGEIPRQVGTCVSGFAQKPHRFNFRMTDHPETIVHPLRADYATGAIYPDDCTKQKIIEQDRSSRFGLGEF